MGGILFAKYLFQCVYKSKDSRCISTFRVYPRVFDKSVIRSVNEGICIEKEKFIFTHAVILLDGYRNIHQFVGLIFHVRSIMFAKKSFEKVKLQIFVANRRIIFTFVRN